MNSLTYLYKIYLLLFLLSFSFSALTKPQNGELINYIHIYFEWDQVPSAISYNVQASNHQSFNNLILNIEENSTAYIDKDNFNWNNNYFWRVRPIYNDGQFGNWINTSSFQIGSTILPNLDVYIYNDELIQDGLNMYSQFSPYVAIGVIDKNGNEIWNTQSVYMNHINQYGQLYGVNGQGVQFNYDQEIIWSTPEGTDIDSHEVKQIPNGNYMAFVPIYQSGPIPQGDWTNLFQSFGYSADGITNEFPWMGLRIVEWDKDTGEEVWNWDPFEHFSMDDHDLYGGMWWDAAFNGRFDWMHTNAFHFDEQESVIYVSHRHLSRISKISYPSGEIIWNMGLPAEYNTGENNICTDLLFSWQHHIQLLDNGDLIFFDNGNLSEMLIGDSNPTTRIRRIRVNDNNGCETVWQYDLPQNLFGAGMGSVQLLENGNYSIYSYGNGMNEGECSILEITPEQELVWKVTSQNQNSAWYRSYKIPSIHPNAFSIVADGYKINENNESIIELVNNSLNFNLYNKSGYNQIYHYIITDTNGMFNNQEGEFTVEPYSNLEFGFQAQDSNINESYINFSIWPVYHEYSKKELSFLINNSNLLGDINNDSVVNIIDVILVVDIILDESNNQSADLNNDGLVNILDIVMIIDFILS